MSVGAWMYGKWDKMENSGVASCGLLWMTCALSFKLLNNLILDQSESVKFRTVIQNFQSYLSQLYHCINTT